MNVRNFIISGFLGGITYYLLGWLFWGILFKDVFPAQVENMLFIFLGCMTFGFFMSFIFSKWAFIVNPAKALKAGFFVSLFIGLHHNFFQYSQTAEPDYKLFLLDLVLVLISGTFVGGLIGFINNKLKL